MELLAPTVTALQTLWEVCHTYAGPHDVVYNTTKTVCMLVRPKQSQGRYSTRLCLGNVELGQVYEFRYVGHIISAESRLSRSSRNLKTIQEATKSWQYAGQEVLICSSGGKIPNDQVIYCYTIYGRALWRHSYTNTLYKLTVSYSDTFKRLVYLPKHQLECFESYQCGLPQTNLQLHEHSENFQQLY